MSIITTPAPSLKFFYVNGVRNSLDEAKIQERELQEKVHGVFGTAVSLELHYNDATPDLGFHSAAIMLGAVAGGGIAVATTPDEATTSGRVVRAVGGGAVGGFIGYACAHVMTEIFKYNVASSLLAKVIETASSHDEIVILCHSQGTDIIQKLALSLCSEGRKLFKERVSVLNMGGVKLADEEANLFKRELHMLHVSDLIGHFANLFFSQPFAMYTGVTHVIDAPCVSWNCHGMLEDYALPSIDLIQQHFFLPLEGQLEQI